VLRNIKGSEILLKNFDRPLFVLTSCVQRVLASDSLLKELVRQADVEWGQLFEQRPYFEKEGCPPDPDDPYTLESVRGLLTRLLEQLTADEIRSKAPD
jgi:hypothetical protein